MFVNAVAALPGGARFISGSGDKTAKLFTFGGELERTFWVGSYVNCVAALPDGVEDPNEQLTGSVLKRSAQDPGSCDGRALSVL